jgi:hypothetical protein
MKVTVTGTDGHATRHSGISSVRESEDGKFFLLVGKDPNHTWTPFAGVRSVTLSCEVQRQSSFLVEAFPKGVTDDSK